MQSRRDQVQAQSYVVGRLTAALVAGQPEAPDNPNRRTVTGTLAGLVVAALVVAGFAVYGLLVPGGSAAWRKPRVLIVEKETGSRYVLVDGTLRPVLNFASARMLFRATPEVVRVSARSMRGVPHGPGVGIAGAPDALPAPAAMSGQVWSVCAFAESDPAGPVAIGTTVRIGRAGPVNAHSFGPDEALLVASVPDRQQFLVWRGRRIVVPEPWQARALGFDGWGMPVQPGWLDILPVGPALPVPHIDGAGEPGPTVDGSATFVGQLFRARGGGTYVLRRDGLSGLNPVAFALVRADPATAVAYGTRPVTPTELDAPTLARFPASTGSAAGPAAGPAAGSAAGSAAGGGWPDGLPVEVPRPGDVPDGTERCVRYTADRRSFAASRQRPVDPARIVRAGPAVTRTDRSAVAVDVEPGVGGLVRAGWPGASPGASFAVVTDAGVRYPLAAPEVAGLLGYDPDRAVLVPPPLLDLLPTGPVLDPAAMG